MLATRLGDIASGRFQGLTAERITVWNLCELVVADYEFHNPTGPRRSSIAGREAFAEAV
jgi:hypothetical protein